MDEVTLVLVNAGMIALVAPRVAQLLANPEPEPVLPTPSLPDPECSVPPSCRFQNLPVKVLLFRNFSTLRLVFAQLQC